MSGSAYYAWATRAHSGPSVALLEEARLANLIWDVFWAARGRYGSPRVSAELWRQGVKANHKTVEANDGRARSPGPVREAQGAHHQARPQGRTGT